MFLLRMILQTISAAVSANSVISAQTSGPPLEGAEEINDGQLGPLYSSYQ